MVHVVLQSLWQSVFSSAASLRSMPSFVSHIAVTPYLSQKLHIEIFDLSTPHKVKCSNTNNSDGADVITTLITCRRRDRVCHPVAAKCFAFDIDIFSV